MSHKLIPRTTHTRRMATRKRRTRKYRRRSWKRLLRTQRPSSRSVSTLPRSIRIRTTWAKIRRIVRSCWSCDVELSNCKSGWTEQELTNSRSTRTSVCLLLAAFLVRRSRMKCPRSRCQPTSWQSSKQICSKTSTTQKAKSSSTAALPCKRSTSCMRCLLKSPWSRCRMCRG